VGKAITRHGLLTRRITHSANSTALNQSRLQVLRAREEHLQSIFEEATKKTKDLKEDRDKYAKVLEDLILEVSEHLDKFCGVRRLALTTTPIVCYRYSSC
jgi:vacuolar-type H+-ATPase subunit E/Vma4